MTTRAGRWPVIRAGLAAMCAAGLWVGTSHGQTGRFDGRAKVVVQDTGLPAIDRGVREQDRPRLPRAGRGPLDDGPDVRASRSATFLAGSVIVKFKHGTGTAAVASAMRAVAAIDRTRPEYANFDILAIPAGADAEVVCAELRTRPDVEYAQPRYLNHSTLRPNDPLYGRQWSLSALDMERAWDIQPGATADVIVAVLDSGVAYRTAMVRYTSAAPVRIDESSPVLPALGVVDVPFAAAPELGDPSRFVAPRDFIWDDDLPLDLSGHGTHVAGTIGQLTNNGVGVAGMAFNVRIMPVKVIQGFWDEIFNSPFAGTDDVVARGIRYAVDQGAQVINMSIARTLGGPATVVEDALAYAVSRGVFVAVAAGNSRDEGNQPNRLAEPAARLAGVVSVGAVSRDLDLAYYSTTGAYVELVAPGGDQHRHGNPGGILQQTLDLDLLLTFEGPPEAYTAPRADAFAYYYFQGTSMATPHVSGLAALLIQQGITSPAAIEAAMTQFAIDKGAQGRDDLYGHGLISPRASLRGLGLAR